MAYVHKLLTKDEEMIGIARLHWIYVIKGIGWFFGLTFAGWLVQSLILRGLSYVADGLNSSSLTIALMPLLNFIIFIPMAIGFTIFVFNVIKVLSTEIGLTNRRVIKKTGWLFVKTFNIDMEEIRGENTDTGIFGRFLNYAYIDLDCRFIGDVRIDAIERPNLFMRHLHKQRAEAQDSIRMIVGKSGTQNPVEIVPAMGGDANPEVAPPKPQPEIAPNTPTPEMPPQPEPPAIDPPDPSPPPTKDGLPPLKPPSPYPSKEDPKAQAEKKAQEGQQQQGPQQQPPGGPVAIDPQTVAQVVQQVMPQMAQEVVKQMTEQGLIHPDKHTEEEKPEDDIDIALIHSFDEARTKDKGNDLHDKLEHTLN